MHIYFIHTHIYIEGNVEENLYKLLMDYGIWVDNFSLLIYFFVFQVTYKTNITFQLEQILINHYI